MLIKATEPSPITLVNKLKLDIDHFVRGGIIVRLACLLFDWFRFISVFTLKFRTDLLVWSNPNQ